MRILTVENKVYDLDTIPDEVDDSRMYGVLDTSDKDFVDLYFWPLYYLESFNAAAICLQIGKFQIQMPGDWSILICDEDFTSLEIMELASLTNSGYRTLTMNPLTDNTLESAEIQITNVYSDIKWHFPKLKHGHVLAVPLEDTDNPKCAYFVKDKNKVGPIDVSDLI